MNSKELDPSLQAAWDAAAELVTCHLVTSCGCTRDVNLPFWEAEFYKKTFFKVPLPENKSRYFKYLRPGSRGPEADAAVYVFVEVPI